MKKIHLSILLLLCALCASQVQAASTINGMLVDARDTTALIAATVKLLKAGRDSTYVDGVVTDAKGIFNLKGVKPGHYIIKCSYLGYDNATRRVTVGTDGRDVNVGLIALDMSGKMLDEVVVQGVKTPITARKTPSSTMPTPTRPRPTPWSRTCSSACLAWKWAATARSLPTASR